MGKNQRVRAIQEKHVKQLNKTTEAIHSSRRYHRALESKVKDIQNLNQELLVKKEEFRKKQIVMNKAAEKIQKVVRGHFTRKKFEDEWYRMKEIKLKQTLNEISSSKRQYLYSVGRLPGIAATVLQRAWRKYFFYKKILRIKKTYEQILREKEEMTYQKVKRLLPVMIDRMTVKELRFEKYKAKRLVAIKRKLAILQIKSVFLREKITWKIVRIRIRKFKRNMKVNVKRSITKKLTVKMDPQIDIKKEETKRKEDQKKDLNKKESPRPEIEQKENLEKPLQINLCEPETKLNIEDSKISNLPDSQNLLSLPMDPTGLSACQSQETIVTTSTEKEAIIRAELLKKLEEERQIKIALGRISYNVREKDEARLLPYLKTVSGADLPPTLSPKLEPLKMPQIKEKKDLEPLAPASKRNKPLTNAYMRETISFQLSHMDTEEPVESVPVLTSAKIRNNSTLMAPTAAFTQKISGNPSARSHSTETKTGEKLIVPNKKFASIAYLEVPQLPSQMKRVKAIIVKPPKPAIKEPESIAEVNTFRRVSLTFQDALPEFSGFLTQYNNSHNKFKLDPIGKNGKVNNSEVLEI